MWVVRQQSIEALRRRARQCRSLSSGALPFAVTAELDAMAEQFESEALRLERVSPPQGLSASWAQHGDDDPVALLLG